MNNPKIFFPIFLASLFLSQICDVASAQRKPDAPPPPPPAPLPDFEPLYVRLGEPVMVVRVEVRGNVPEDRRNSFERRLGTLFMGRSPIVEIVYPKASELRDIRNFTTMVNNDAIGAAQALANRTNSDVGVVVKLDGVGNDIEASYVIFDNNRGRLLDEWAWTIEANRGIVGNPDLQYWCENTYKLMYRRLNDRFSGQLFTYSIHLVDMPDQVERDLRNALRRVDGVEGKIRLQQDRAKGENVSSFRVRLRGRDKLDLRDDARDALARIMNIDVSRIEALSTGEADITMRVLPGETPDRFAGLEGDESSSQPARVDSFQDAYVKACEPRIGLVINHKVRDAAEIRGHQDKETGKLSGHPTIRPGDHNIYTRFERMETRHIEDNMMQRFRHLGANVVSINSRVQQIAKEHDYQLLGMKDFELALQQLNSDAADLVIIGLGNVVSIGGSEFELRYTFRAITPRDSYFITSAQPTQSIRYSDADNVNDLLTLAETGIAEDAVKELAGQLMLHWQKPGRIRVEVQNLGSYDGVMKIANFVEKELGPEYVKSLSVGRFKGGSDEQSGLGSFDIVYKGDCNSFLHAFQNAVSDADAPYRIMTKEAGPQLIRLQASPKE